MKVPTKLTALTARLMGKTGAHETAESLAAALDEQIEQLREERVPEHLADAAGMGGMPAYQVGLVDLRGDMYDAAVLLDALTTTAAALGDADLVQALREAGETAHELVARLTVAAHATLPVPLAPAVEAA